VIDLVTFLLARIAEDKAEALAAQHVDGPKTLQWREGGTRRLRFDNGRSETYASVFAGDWDRILVARDDVHGGPVASHIARWDPARVLAECEAKRRIVGNYLSAARVSEQTFDTSNVLATAKTMVAEGIAEAHLRDLRALALPYADHPDFSEEWRR
jgi:hypothetical protein